MFQRENRFRRNVKTTGECCACVKSIGVHITGGHWKSRSTPRFSENSFKNRQLPLHHRKKSSVPQHLFLDIGSTNAHHSGCIAKTSRSLRCNQLPDRCPILAPETNEPCFFGWLLMLAHVCGALVAKKRWGICEAIQRAIC